ncbi:inositol monophosphatase family protein [Corynebacterium renale]|uniref:inositol monophosphatase family protein n=1 Tax=Corynebacterium renale TaxID=1724 RepID=UPI000DFF925D|nr:inositol monophosphatase family protein [Corynebacterium renale]STC94655.1 fructose-1,6-bisphosphatase [Corynebacterium renale]
MSEPAADFDQMLAAIIKTFAVAHTEDSDEHLAQALVFNAGRLAWRMRESGVTTEQKTNISDVVTEADRAAEKFVAGALEILRPEDGILGEEGAARESQSGKTWVIDPVDGTYNFVAGSDYWCSALALVKGDPHSPDELLFGAVHRPAMGYTWFGGPKIPTTRDGKEVHVQANTPLDHASVATYLHPTWMQVDAVRNAWIKAVQQTATVRMLCSGSVDMSGVADGTWSAWVQHSVPAWDWLPGRALVEGAGGTTVEVEAHGVVWRIAGNKQSVADIATHLREA